MNQVNENIHTIEIVTSTQNKKITIIRNFFITKEFLRVQSIIMLSKTTRHI